jgi:hypothetical protein
METEIPETSENETTAADSEWDNRILCSDGNCIGVIGADGHCKECGREYEGPLPEMIAAESIEQTEEQEEEATSPETEVANAGQDPPADDGWDNRILCSDGNCIGVIGPDGKCKECGKPYDS